MPNENHQPDKPLPFGCNYELGPLPETNYVIGHPGDGYSQDRCSTWPAWDDDQVKAYALREVQKAVAADRERWKAMLMELAAGHQRAAEMAGDWDTASPHDGAAAALIDVAESGPNAKLTGPQGPERYTDEQ